MFFLAQNSTPPQSSAAPPVETRSRVLPEQSGFRRLEGTTFGFGAYVERLQYRTAARYSAPGVGIILSLDQHIRGWWSGGLQLRWNDWKPWPSSVEEVFNVSPLSLYSRVELAPRLTTWLGESLGTVVRPFGVVGLGGMTFLGRRGLPLSKAKRETSDVNITMGGGIRLVWPDAAALRFSVERWRGLRTFRYSSMTYQVEVQFGDVNRP